MYWTSIQVIKAEIQLQDAQNNLPNCDDRSHCPGLTYTLFTARVSPV